MKDMQKQMEDMLRESLHYDFDEEACVISLNIAKTASNLIKNGVLLPCPEKLAFHEGCLQKQDFHRVVCACRDIGSLVWDTPTSGISKDDVDYIPIVFMRDPEEVEDALRTVMMLLKEEGIHMNSPN